MLKQIMITASLAAILGFSITGYAQEPSPNMQKAFNALKQKLGDGWIIEWKEQRTGIKRIYKEHENWTKSRKTPSPSMQGTQKDIAMTFLKENASLFQLPADIGDLRVLRADDDGYVLFEQTFNGLPVFDRRIGVSMNLREGIYNVTNNYLPNINISTTPLLSEDDVIAIAQEDTLKNQMTTGDKSGGRNPIPIEEQKNPFTERPQLELGVYVTEKKEPVLVYKFILKALGDLVHTRYVIDANNGTIVHAGDSRMYGYDAVGARKYFLA
ncbi:MAG: hypothetical protein ACXWTS_03240 [Methylococcaceae bacterium]